jgi:hypothetical protein
MKASKRDTLKVWILSILMGAGLWSFTSCQESKKPSYIIIAADQLSFNSFSCNEDKNDKTSGLTTLCQESIRFTNAFTTSTQSAAALGSLLSGTYPYMNNLHRSFDRIHPNLPLLPEFFKQQGYRTSFWSAKPSVLKKTGLARGFDIFDDASFLSQPRYSMPFKEQLGLFENWASESDTAFFSVIYTSELESLNEGEAQISGLENFDEKLGQFFDLLKSKNMWESNYIIVVGLQGKSEYNRPFESVFSNLHTESTNIALFIKPPRQKGDEGINWKVDSTMTIADFGYSLIKTIKPDFKTIQDNIYPLVDYSRVWIKNSIESTVNPQRKIILEAANTWSQNMELRFALVFKNYLFLESEKNEFYNKLNDGLETIDLIDEQSEIKTEDLKNLSTLRQNIGASKWINYRPPQYQWVLSNREYWAQPNNRAALFEVERKRLLKEKTSQPLSTLLIYFLNNKLEKDSLFEEARRNSYNLSLENIWGLWNQNRQWPQPDVKTENQ